MSDSSPYAQCVANSERISWKLDELLPESAVFDRTRRFLPEALAPNASLTFLSADERRLLNQIAGKAYMNLFGFVEVYIEAMVLEHAQAAMFGDRDQMRALVRFADEEIKHQQLFDRYCRLFDQQFGGKTAVLDNAIEVAQIILGTSPLSILLTTLHIEQMTQQHYVESVKDDDGLDERCAEILRSHWLEESQHARIDLLLLEATHAQSGEEARAKAMDEYLGILSAFDGLLARQAEFDATSLASHAGRSFDEAERAQIVAQQHAGYRRTFLISGLTTSAFTKVIGELWPSDSARIAQVAQRYEVR